MLGKVSIGWTLGEEVLFSHQLENRTESCHAETESCLLGINRQKLLTLQKHLLDTENSKDYFVLESTLKGNHLLKNQWRRDIADGKLPNDEAIDGVTMHGSVLDATSRRNPGKSTFNS